MTFSFSQPMVCLACLDRSAYLAFDKHGRPFIKCGSGCGTIMFLKSKAALRGVAWLSEIADETRRRIASDATFRAEREAEFAAFDAALSRRYIELEQARQPIVNPVSPSMQTEVARGGDLLRREQS